MSKTEDWKTETALKRYQIIAPLMDDALDAVKNRNYGKSLPGKTAYRKEAYIATRVLTQKAGL